MHLGVLERYCSLWEHFRNTDILKCLQSVLSTCYKEKLFDFAHTCQISSKPGSPNEEARFILGLVDTFQFFFVTSVATSYSSRTKQNSSACELHFLPGMGACHLLISPCNQRSCSSLQWPVHAAPANAFAGAEDGTRVGATHTHTAPEMLLPSSGRLTGVLLQGYQYSTKNLSLKKGHICLVMHPPAS